MTTKEEKIKYIRRAIQKASMGDSLILAEREFKGLSDLAMQQFYGSSGKTRQEVLDGYRQMEQLNKEAAEYFESLIR